MAESKARRNAIATTRAQDFPEWYQLVVKGADLADASPVRGCMIIRPWGMGIWERIQKGLDRRIQETGHENCYFPLLIPLSFFEKEAEHVEGFAKEMAVVTHHRLESRDGRLVPAGELDEPLVIRPTSETLVGEAFVRWIGSYRDLPLKVNQWANVMRWEMRTRTFLRTSEFLWQEGHTAHASAEEAMEETRLMAGVYREFAEGVLGMPVVAGEKPAHERFPGAENTLCIEAMMQDGKALQAGTSHFLGQRFAKSAGIRFQTAEGGLEHAWTTSWGVSTRLIGGVVMTHGDDDGLRLPPRIAPSQIAIVPVARGDEGRAAIDAHIDSLDRALRAASWDGEPVRARVDRRQMASADKKWDWVRKGAPLVVEIGARDAASGGVFWTRRDDGSKGTSPSVEAFAASVPDLLSSIQDALSRQAGERMEARTIVARTRAEIVDALSIEDASTRPFVRALWAPGAEGMEILDSVKASVRCLPDERRLDGGACALTGAAGAVEAVLARSY